MFGNNKNHFSPHDSIFPILLSLPVSQPNITFVIPIWNTTICFTLFMQKTNFQSDMKQERTWSFYISRGDPQTLNLCAPNQFLLHLLIPECSCSLILLSVSFSIKRLLMTVLCECYSPGYSDNNAYWVGASDKTYEGDFRWSDGLPFSYTSKYIVILAVTNIKTIFSHVTALSNNVSDPWRQQFSWSSGKYVNNGGFTIGKSGGMKSSESDHTAGRLISSVFVN